MPEFTQPELWLLLMGGFGIGFAVLGIVTAVLESGICDFESPYKCEVIHGIGLFPAVGMITGWVDVGK